MTRFLLVAACLVFPSLALSAPADSTQAPSRANSLRAGAWALQFIAVDGFSGGGVLVKRHVNPGHAYRAGFSFSGESRSGDFIEDTTAVAIGEGTSEDKRLELSAELLSQHYLNPQGPAHVYLCVGPFVTASEDHSEDRRVMFGETRASKRDYEVWRVGGKLVLGGEWFASRSLSLAVEYAVRAGYLSSTEEFSDQYQNSPVDHRKTNETGWFADGGGSRLALGIYF